MSGSLLRGARLPGLLLLLPLLFALGACGPQPPAYIAPRIAPPLGGQVSVAPNEPPRDRVGLLVPLSGGNRALGAAMLNAAQLALFDQADPRVELLPRDTGGSVGGAAEAARAALAAGARAFAGPLTRDEASAAASVARAANAPILAFTSDSSLASVGLWVLGLTPDEQADRVVAAAAAAGAQRFGLLAPNDAFGRRLEAAVRNRLTLAALPPPVVVLYVARSDVSAPARTLAEQAGPEGLDAVMIGDRGGPARSAAAALAAALPRPARLLGTALWLQDATLGQEPALVGAWFAAPDPAARQNFEARYTTAFGERPPPLAGLAYDAAPLSLRAVRDGGGSPPVGVPMMGADGPLMLLPDGQARRGLAILAVQAGGDPALVEGAQVPTAAAGF